MRPGGARWQRPQTTSGSSWGGWPVLSGDFPVVGGPGADRTSSMFGVLAGPGRPAPKNRRCPVGPRTPRQIWKTSLAPASRVPDRPNRSQETRSLTLARGHLHPGDFGHRVGVHSVLPQTRVHVFWSPGLMIPDPFEAKSFAGGREVDPPGAPRWVFDHTCSSCGRGRRCRFRTRRGTEI